MNRNQKHAKNRRKAVARRRLRADTGAPLPPVQQRESIAAFMASMDGLLRMAEAVLTLHREQPTDTEAQLEGWTLVEELCRVTAVQARNLQTLLQHHGQELTFCDHCDLYRCPGDDHHHEADHDDDESLAS